MTYWSNPDYFDIDALVDAFGNVPATFLQASFQMMKPVQNYYGKYVTFFDKMDDDKFIENYFAMEKWTNDNIPVSGETFREFVKKLYQRNELVKGEFKLGDEPVDLRKITCPLQILMASADHLVPPCQSEALKDLVGSKKRHQVQDARRRPHRPVGQLQGPQDVLARGDAVACRLLEQVRLLTNRRAARSRGQGEAPAEPIHGFAGASSTPSQLPVSRYSLIDAAALRPAAMAGYGGPPVTMSPPAKTPFFDVRRVSGSAAM